MKIIKIKLPRLAFLLFVLINSTLLPAQDVKLNYSYYKISNDKKVDSSFIKMLMPYKDSLNKSMDKVVGFATNTMYKRQPVSALGNLLADCIRVMAEKKYKRKVDIGIINFGGIRSYIAKGDITIEKIYELMPFDNFLILQELRGDTLQMLLNKIAEKGGWPLSGISMQIKNHKALNVVVNGQALDSNKVYTVTYSDYIANGGDECSMLKGIPQINAGYVLRDAIIQYIKDITEQGNPIEAKIEKRITYAN